ncbi:MAG: DUF1559 domain-containing protein, partial [Candidatus Hydrogenedentes bacterium]|nr:DUF1559 domain-containing protein [Candidatus Hydrogenedentota bacterium]
ISILASLLLPALARAREQARRTHCANNLKQMGLVFIMYANENNDVLPPGSPNGYWGDPNYYDFSSGTNTGGYGYWHPQLIRNNFIFDVESCYPDYLDDLEVLVCKSALAGGGGSQPERWYADETFAPERIDRSQFIDPDDNWALAHLQGLRPDPECVTSQMYTYLPYAVVTEEHGLFLWDELCLRMSLGRVDFMDDNIMLPGGHGPGGGNTFYRTRIGISRLFIRDINNPAREAYSDSDVPVLFDSASQLGRIVMNHYPRGGNVLYLDGHVQFREYPDPLYRLPYTQFFVEFLRANIYDNYTLMNVPPWCGNRLPGTAFEPRYYYYPDDPMYDPLDIYYG